MHRVSKERKKKRQTPSLLTKPVLQTTFVRTREINLELQEGQVPEFIQVLLLAALPALGNFAGGIAAEVFPVSRRTLSLALHFAAGIILAVVGVEIVPEALQAEPSWVIPLAFLLGGGFFILMDYLIDIVRARFGSKGSSSPWTIYSGVAIDLFSDGVMIGTGSTIALGLALLLALGHVSADIPEGFATIATLKRRNIPRKTRLLLSASFAIPIFVGATVGYWLVRGQAEILQLALLTFTAGILATLVVEEIVPEFP